MLGNATIVLRYRFLVFLQPAPFLLGPNEAAEALLQAFREVDIHPPRFVEQFDINEEIDGTFLRLSRAHHGFSPSFMTGPQAQTISEQAMTIDKCID
jgi:hypothetical protein